METAPLVEAAVMRGEGKLAADGPLVVETGPHTGRSAKDKFTVRDSETESSVWWGKSNQPMTPEHFKALKVDFLAALADKDDLFVQDLYGGSQPGHRVHVRVINELAWHSLFIRTMLVRPDAHELPGFAPDYTIIDLPSFRADPARHGCRSETVIAVNLEGPFHCAREALRRMLPQGHGVILNISSVHEVIPWSGYSAYAASKAGLSMLTRTLAQEAAPHGVRVLALAPGAIRTGINHSVWEDAHGLADLKSKIPLGRMGRPAEIADMAAVLVSDLAGYVTGTTVFVDGGMSDYAAFSHGG